MIDWLPDVSIDMTTERQFDKRAQRHLQREMRTTQAMLRIYCREVHGQAGLCPECEELLAYTEKRVMRCPHGVEKPNCRNCPIHCFREPQRTQIHAVMRYAGPRMLRHHPWMALRHLLKRWRRPKTKRSAS